MITGSCLCGGVRYRYGGEVEELAICHCAQCRKAQGTPFVTNVPAHAELFTLVDGEELLRSYESSPGKMRVFCSVCGSPLYSHRADKPGWVRLRAGTIDGEFAAGKRYHIYHDSRVAWFDHEDQLVRFDAGKPD